ncbi:MAG: hypothetical protein KA153_04565 [Hyphomonadaceae bacterium]|nr:hypothetical protein [Hyphomonadaceae bacterium]
MAHLKAGLRWPRARHYAEISTTSSAPTAKLEPIAKIVESAGRREPAADVD